jgi:NhaP-type Na+/H+ or K+/H+ antiporter
MAQEKGVCAGVKMGRIGHRPYWVLHLSLGIRAVHQIGAAFFLVSYLLFGAADPTSGYALAAFASGLALFFTEWLRHRQLYREIAGLATLGKLLLLGAAVHGLLPPVPAVLIAFVLASICAHLPKLLRHRLLF